MSRALAPEIRIRERPSDCSDSEAIPANVDLAVSIAESRADRTRNWSGPDQISNDPPAATASGFSGSATPNAVLPALATALHFAAPRHHLHQVEVGEFTHRQAG